MTGRTTKYADSKVNVRMEARPKYMSFGWSIYYGWIEYDSYESVAGVFFIFLSFEKCDKKKFVRIMCDFIGRRNMSKANKPWTWTHALRLYALSQISKHEVEKL